MQSAFSDSSALVRRLSSRYAVRTFRFAAEPSPAPARRSSMRVAAVPTWPLR
jgi:hypothetical protein